MNSQTKYIKLLAIFAFFLLISFFAISANAQNDTVYVIFGNPDGSTLHLPYADTAAIPLWVSRMDGYGGANLQLYIDIDIIPDFINLDFYFDWVYVYQFRPSSRITLVFIPESLPDSLNHIADFNIVTTDNSSYIGQTLDAFWGTANLSDTLGFRSSQA